MKAHKDLTKIKDKFELLANNIEDLVWIMNENLEMIYASPSVFSILGYTPDEIFNNSLFDICTPESAMLLKRGIEQRLAGKSGNEKKDWEITLKHKNGKVLWFSTITTPIWDDHEKFQGVLGVSRDITWRKNAEKQNKVIQANLRAQIENTNDYIWSVNRNYEIKIINTNFKKQFLLNYGIELAPGVNIINDLPEPENFVWKERYDRALQGQHFSIVDQLKNSNGIEFIETTFNPIYLDKKIHGVSCFSRDITQQKRVEKDLMLSEKRIKNFVSNIPSVSYQCVVDKNRTIKFASDEIETLTGYPPQEFIDNKIRTYTSVIHPEDKTFVAEEIRRQSDKNDSFSIQYRIVDKWGETKWVQEWGRFNRNHHGKLDTIDGVMVDVTDQKIAQLRLEENEGKFKTLSEASVEMIGFADPSDTLAYVSKLIVEKYPEVTILATTYNRELKNFKILSVDGAQAEQFNFNHQPKILVNVELKPEIMAILKGGQLRRIKKTSHFIRQIKAAKPIVESIKLALANANLYVIGINNHNNILGAAWVLTPKKRPIKNTGFITSFINLVGLILRQQFLVGALHSSEEKFRSIFEQSNSAISIQTKDKILLVNKAWCRITGYTEEESKTLNPKYLVHLQDRESVREMVENRLQGKDELRSYILHLIDKKGNEKWLELSASVINYEGEKATLMIASDITTRKNDELKLIKFSSGIINSPASIVITDIEGNIEYVNPHFLEFTGYTSDEVIGENARIWKSGFTPLEVYKDMWNNILSGNVWMGELQNRKKNGALFWENITIAPIINNEGVVISFIAIKIDITDRVDAMTMLEKSQHDLEELNAKKDKFFSIIAHDLRGPFGAISGLSDLLNKNYSQLSEPEIKNYLELLNQSSQNVFKLLENLLAWAKTQTGRIVFNPESLNLYDIAQETIKMLGVSAENKSIQIQNKIPVDICLKADKNMLLTIFRNFVTNAIKYTHRNGLIELGSVIETNESIKLVKIWIKDNGVGIPEDKIHKIFKIEENYTTKGTEKEKGSGLGLILCKEFIDKHQGQTWVESVKNQGSTFFFTLPL